MRITRGGLSKNNGQKSAEAIVLCFKKKKTNKGRVEHEVKGLKD